MSRMACSPAGTAPIPSTDVTFADHIPLVDLGAQHKEVAEEVLMGFERVLDDASFIGGSDVTRFEAEFAAYCDRRNVIGVANGTDAIELALRGLGVGPGDEVIVPANTFIATAEAVVRAGADVTLADCDEDFLLVDPDSVAERVGHRTAAIVAVDLYGQMAPLERVADLAARRGLVVVEDAAQSQGATRHGRPIGSGVHAGATSFYPGKNLGAYGDAGAVLTDDDALATAIRAIANHGGTVKYEHRLMGCNSRLDTLQAVVLRAKLARLDGWNEARRQAARRYVELLSAAPSVSVPAVAPGNVPVWHLFVVRVPERDRVMAGLHAAGIGAGIHYPQPVHLTGAFAHLGHGPGDFPVAEAAAAEILTLPLHPHITPDQQARVVDTLVALLP
jgi:dTDP-4-amino-4,6-dideoxygalactose transaminase